jgi:glutaredoxin
MKHTVILVAALLLHISGFAQENDIEIFEKKDGNKNIVVARNTGKVSYLVALSINSKGMNVTPGAEVEAVVPAGMMKEMATIVARPGESWSYGYDVSFTEYAGEPLKTKPSSPGQPEAPVAPIATPAVPTAPKTELSKAPIIVYTQAGCGRCSSVKSQMKAKGITYEEVDVNSGSPEASNMWKQLRDGGFTGESVTMPVVKVNGQLHYNIKDLTGFVNGLKSEK